VALKVIEVRLRRAHGQFRAAQVLGKAVALDRIAPDVAADALDAFLQGLELRLGLIGGRCGRGQRLRPEREQDQQIRQENQRSRRCHTEKSNAARL